MILSPLVRALVDASPDAASVVDRDLDLVYFNVNYAELSGLRPRELSRRNVRGMCHAHFDLESCAEGCVSRRAIESGRTCRVDEVASNRLPLRLIVVAVPLFDDSGAVWAVIEQYRNVTAESRMQDNYRRMLEQERAQKAVLEAEVAALVRQSVTSEKLAAVGHLAAGLAHEINTPLQYVNDNVTFVRRAVDLLLQVSNAATAVLKTSVDDPSPDLRELARCIKKARLDYLRPQAPRALDQAQEGLERIAHIVGAMKEFAQPSSEEKEVVDLGQAITTTLTVASGEWKYVAETEIDFDPEMPGVLVLRNELNQVLLNLVINAAHAIADVAGSGSGHKGTIGLRTRREQDWAVIEVSDTGTGIPDGIRGKIFDPFFTTKPVGKGTGQGLAIAHNVIVERHGGRIEVVSEIGKGSTFVIRLPLSGAVAPRAVVRRTA